ncbi:MAG: squalene/phytoene synthase family protein [Alphaproteobacteria bacterium]
MNTISTIVKGNQNSFFWLMQFLPKAKKVGAYTIFAFNHHVEKEIVKSDLSNDEKLEMLNAWREEIDNIFDKKVPQTDIGRKIYKNCLRFSLKKQTFVDVIEAYIDSIREYPFNPTLAEYMRYARGVYGGRIEMGLKIFNVTDKQISLLMAEFIHPVVALENMKEDTLLGFIYTPKEFLRDAGITSKVPQEIIVDPKLSIAREKMLKLASENLLKLEAYYKNVDKKNLKIIRGFANIYKKYLEIMQTRGMEVIAPKPLLSNFAKMKIILKSMLG